MRLRMTIPLQKRIFFASNEESGYGWTKCWDPTSLRAARLSPNPTGTSNGEHKPQKRGADVKARELHSLGLVFLQ